MRQTALTLFALLIVFNSPATDAAKFPGLEALDQRSQSRKIVFPSSRPALLFLADRRSADAIDQWPEKALRRLGTDVDILGVANLKGVPRVLGPLVIRKLGIHANPVLLDWQGIAASFAGAAEGKVTILVLDSKGVIRDRLESPWTEDAFASICDRAAELAGK